jgi:hypothetical protein
MTIRLDASDPSSDVVTRSDDVGRYRAVQLAGCAGNQMADLGLQFSDRVARLHAIS